VSAPLVFDIGLHLGEDTAYYLARGYRVLAVDADARMVERAAVRFGDAVADRRLTLLNAAVSDRGGSTIEFHLSRNTIWSSADARIAGRQGMGGETVEVETRTLAQLIAEFGTPLYCKVDIEGLDAAALRSLANTTEPPAFVSTETECLGQDVVIGEEEALATFTCLTALGYRRFKLVDQRSLVVLEPGRGFYSTHDTLFNRLLGTFGRKDWHLRRRVIHRLGYAFPVGASGPFGQDLDGSWLDSKTARETLLLHRGDYFASSSAVPFGFWCDWHAAR
jgi:FkbM family methyltransferase